MINVGEFERGGRIGWGVQRENDPEESGFLGEIKSYSGGVRFLPYDGGVQLSRQELAALSSAMAQIEADEDGV